MCQTAKTLRKKGGAASEGAIFLWFVGQQISGMSNSIQTNNPNTSTRSHLEGKTWQKMNFEQLFEADLIDPIGIFRDPITLSDDERLGCPSSPAKRKVNYLGSVKPFSVFRWTFFFRCKFKRKVIYTWWFKDFFAPIWGRDGLKPTKKLWINLGLKTLRFQPPLKLMGGFKYIHHCFLTKDF